ncbi:MAG TPA: ribonuclease Z [Flavobacterium sp.]|jgi:CRISPR/Cas system type I-B associated protein Csh2 (Cas7 group RAMP superfamily)|uniref:ribonuclease Z n=1 Tax=Flavobacterium sp. TaxID=239 RepID=UPI002B8C433B|nr:ribonuclease Z [Flavobacterium sp.]MCA0350340.1 ribonuclease Z [Bacteroidota bacterium]HPW98957.1 ribonuclease Z [Flavobacterium sp.]HQA75042.1 ribonuclease Z [Flavobacterium sp.]
MKVEQKGNNTIIKNTQYKTAEFLSKLSQEYTTFKDKNLIVDISFDAGLKLVDVKSFSDLIKKHKKNKKSFVLVANDFDFNTVPASITLVPSILEAHDIIEMEEIERDLGF